MSCNHHYWLPIYYPVVPGKDQPERPSAKCTECGILKYSGELSMPIADSTPTSKGVE